MSTWVGSDDNSLIESWGSPESSFTWTSPPKEINKCGFKFQKTSTGDPNVFWVEKNSPAEDAGLKKGDIIISVNSEELKNKNRRNINKLWIKNLESCNFTVQRNNKLIKFKIPVGKFIVPEREYKTFTYMDGWSKSWTSDTVEMDLDGNIYNDTTSHSASGICKKIMKFAKLDNQWRIVKVNFKGCG
tara:strand:+ start:234 stop:794 length:561 start_codon:yes stop_codon:yes gene_type:complete